MTIRAATPADREHLEAFARSAWDERGYGATAGSVNWADLDLTEHAIALLAETDRPIGCFIVALVPHPLSGLLYADQMLWYVVPEARRTRTGPDLLDTMRAACRVRGITQLLLHRPSRQRESRYLIRRGATPLETLWLCPTGHSVHSRGESS